MERYAVKVVETPIVADDALNLVRSEDCGAVVLFLGTVRNHSHGRKVIHLNYTAYREMAEKELATIAEEATSQDQIARVAIVHRIGKMKPGEISVAIAVAAHHREGTFDACRAAIETLKKRVPIWKEEFFEDGSQWVGRCDHETNNP